MEYIIDCSGITDRKELHRILAKALSFPEWYGHNLDALYDCLTSISVDTHVILKNWDTLPPFFQGFKTVLEEAEENNLCLTVSFTGKTEYK